MSDDLKAELAAAKAELRRLRDAAELSNTIMEGMRNNVIRAKVQALQAVDVDAVEALISRRIAMSETGELYAVDTQGMPLIGAGPDFGNVGIDAYLNQVARDRPALFETNGNGGSLASKRGNPWVEGPGFSITEQMVLLNTAPERAARLQAEAGVVSPDRA